MAQMMETGPLQIQHGHTDTQVLIKFTRVTDHLLLTDAQAEAFIAAMQHSRKQLAEHRAKKQN